MTERDGVPRTPVRGGSADRLEAGAADAEEACSEGRFSSSESCERSIGTGLAVSLSTTPVTAIAGAVNANIATVSAAGGIGPYTFAVNAGTPLPTGVSLDPNTGIISTAATTVFGSTSVTITATDGTLPTPVTGTITFTISITHPGLAMGLGVTPILATAGFANAALSSVIATGGTAPYTIAVVGTLPTGVYIASNGVISVDTTTVVGTPSITVNATDSTAGTHMTGTMTFTINIRTPLTLTVPTLSATTATVANANIGTLTSTGTTPTFSVVGSLPTGIHISAGGVISSDTTTSAGTTAAITVHSVDSTGTLGTATFTIPILTYLTIPTSSLTVDPSVATASVTTLTVSNDAGTIHFAQTSALAWVNVAQSGLVSTTGSTPGSGTFTLSVTATDQTTFAVGSQNFTITINGALGLNGFVASVTGAVGDPNNAVLETVTGTGGSGGYAGWTLNSVSGTNCGLKLVLGALEFDGTQQAGTCHVTITMHDSASTSFTSGDITVTINSALTLNAVTTALSVDAGVTVANLETLGSTGGSGFANWTSSITGSSCAGITVSTSGVISTTGGSLVVGTCSFTVTAHDTLGASAASGTITVTINSALTLTSSDSFTATDASSTSPSVIGTAVAGGGNSTYNAITSVVNGSACPGDVSIVAGVVTFTQNGSTGSCNVTFTVTDTAHGTATLTETITIN